MSTLLSRIENAVELGDLPLFARLVSLPTVDVHTDDEAVFRVACYFGNRQIVEFLLRHAAAAGQPVDVHVLDDAAIDIACQNGHTSTVQLLLHWCQHSVDITRHEQEVFRHACFHGHTGTARFLTRYCRKHTARPALDVGFENHRAFRGACWNLQFPTARWLVQHHAVPKVFKSFDDDFLVPSRLFCTAVAMFCLRRALGCFFRLVPPLPQRTRLRLRRQFLSHV